MAVLRSLVTTLGLNSAQYRAGLRQAQSSMVSFGAKVRSVASGSKTALSAMSSSVLNMKTALVAVGSGAALYGIKQAYEHADSIRRQGEMIGVSADRWSQYTYAARICGVETDRMTDAFKDLGIKITDAAKTGSGPMVDFFKQINGSAKEWSAMAPDEQFRRFNEELNKMSDADARFYLDELNDGAYTLFETLRNGELMRLAKESEELGLSLSKVQFGVISDARKDMETLAATGAGLWQQVLAAAAPAVSAVSQGIRQWVVDQAKAAGGFKQLGIIIAETVLQTVVDTAHALENMLNGAYLAAEELAGMVGKTLNPKRASIENHLDYITEKMRAINQSAKTVAGLGDAPPMLVYNDAEQEKMNELRAIAYRLREELSKPINFANGLEDQIDSVINKVRATGIDVINSPNVNQGNSTSNRPISVPTGAVVVDDAKKDQMTAELARLRESMMTELDLINQNEIQKKTNLAAWWKAGIDDLTDFEALYTKITQKAQEERDRLTSESNKKMLKDGSQLFGSMADLTKTFAGKQSSAYKAMFAVSKAFAIAESIIAIQEGIAKASRLGFPEGIPAMASVAAATAGIVSTISSTNVQGMAHDGIDYIPREGTWLLDRGERVVDSRTNADLKQYLSNQNSPAANWQIIINEAPPGTTTMIDEKAQIIEIAVGKAVTTFEENVRRGGNSTANTMEQTYGLNRAWGI